MAMSSVLSRLPLIADGRPRTCLEVEADDVQGQVQDGGVVSPEVLVAGGVAVTDSGVDHQLPWIAEERAKRIEQRLTQARQQRHRPQKGGAGAVIPSVGRSVGRSVGDTRANDDDDREAA